MQATRNSWLIARNQNRTVFLSEQLLMIYLLPSLFFSASPRLRVSVVSRGCFRMDRRLSKTTQAPKNRVQGRL
jgi:hypothetical protein